jgi:hypothetical protein
MTRAQHIPENSRDHLHSAMRPVRRLFSFLAIALCSGCVSNPESTSYAEWQQEQKARWEAKQAGIEYKTKEQLRKEAEELRAIAAEVMNANVRKTPADTAPAKPASE